MLDSRGVLTWGASVVAAMVLAGCGSTSLNQAPVEDRGLSAGRAPTSTTATPNRIDPATLPGAENAGKPGYYTVKPGETLMRIAADNGQNWRDIARWSNLENPNVIEVGQVLRVVPPVTATATAAPAATAPAVTGANTPAATPAPAPAPAAAASAPAAADGNLGFIWPSSGAVIAGFDDARNKGLDIGGKAGDPVVAAADGRVIYSGAGLRGYGNLILIKHNNTYLTAYAHNQTLLVKDDQVVKKGQKIAEMGSSDADRVKLHFEVRRQGKPVDPSRYLPSR
ncbi:MULTISPECIES: peptidoglycan DD-metalloendopeptidase family protein [unclassified Comamonas]|jgi:lipoprotein NlpD|uniref:peptidoglycan DD-metalloendopeptidase family protein n=1 Tax=Comamonas TaxID=283 RepID=UPI001EFB2C4F|nr:MULTISPECIES: peptidoglycan DD-metalloendopeptidase family protein [unclassified Comamonas]ULR91251.1 peptidoglycan DD-metalloendopeptidase family protein [Comamonas sp. B21-038]